MRARSRRSAGAGMWDTFKLEWEIGLQRLPFFTQRLAVALLGLLLVSLALVGAMMILWGGPQSSDLPLRPPPEARQPAGPPSGGIEPPGPPQVRGGGGVPAGARSSTSSSSSSTSSTMRRGATTTRGATAGAGTTTTTAPKPTSDGDDLVPRLTVPPVLTTLLR